MRGHRAAAGAGRAALQRGVSGPQVGGGPLRPRCCPAGPPLAGIDLTSAQCRSFGSRGPHFEGFFGGGFPGGQSAFGGGAQPKGDTDGFYNVLGVDKTAGDKEIKSAYKKQAMEHHPDRGGDDAKFKEISRAYEVLSSSEKRQIYDTYGEEGLESMEKGGAGGGRQHTDPFDIFQQMFGFGAGRQPRGKPVTPDARYEMQMSLEELYAGTTREIVYTRDAVCGTCSGRGGLKQDQCGSCNGAGVKVQQQQVGPFVQQFQTTCGPCKGKGWVIPPGNTCSTCTGKGVLKEKQTFSIDVQVGTSDQTEFRFTGKADEAPGHDAGDVAIVITQKEHKVFHRVKDSLVMTKKISLSEALCGFQFTTEFLDGSELVIKSSPNQVVKPGDVMVINGKGMPRSSGGPPGDLFLILEVQFPASIPEEKQAELYANLDGPDRPEEKEGSMEAKSLSARRMKELKYMLAEQKANKRNEGRGGGDGDPQCTQM